MRTLIRPTVALAAILAILVSGMRWPDPTAAATVALKWVAQIEVAGVRPQGSATFLTYTSGTGALGLRLTGLRPATSYWVALYSGTCARLGARVGVLPTVASNMSGAMTRGLTLSRALTARLRTLLRGGLSVAIGSVRRCGTLAPLPLSPSPTATPIPTLSPTPVPPASPTPTPTPTPYDPGPPYTY